MKTSKPDIYLALVHWPCWNQKGEVVCTNVTHFDIHDIARTCRTYGIGRYIIVNKAQEQQMFVHRVLDHWRVGEGSDHNAQRRTAVSMVRTAATVEEALNDMPVRPLVVATSAQAQEKYPTVGFAALRERLNQEPDRPLFLIFGTGWGLTDDVLKMCDFILDPITGNAPDDYRHLSVRSAVAICLDRLLGRW